MSDPNMFNAAEEPLLSQAFATAWRALTEQQPDLSGSIALQSRIASALIAAVAQGIVDPARLAKSAIERCSLPAPNSPRIGALGSNRNGDQVAVSWSISPTALIRNQPVTSTSSS
jgi:hypothetical protein